MGGSLIFNVLVYTHNGGSPEKCPKVYTPYGDLSVENAQVYTPDDSQKNKEMVYTPMGGSLTINVMVHAHFGGLTRIKVQTFTPVLSRIV